MCYGKREMKTANDQQTEEGDRRESEGHNITVIHTATTEKRESERERSVCCAGGKRVQRALFKGEGGEKSARSPPPPPLSPASRFSLVVRHSCACTRLANEKKWESVFASERESVHLINTRRLF